MLPILYQSPEFTLYSYPLLMGIGWGVGYQIFFSLFPHSISRKIGQLIFWGIFLFAWLGAKILFMATIPRDLSVEIMNDFSFWTGGGFVFYGGLIGGALFVLLYRLLKLPWKFEIFWAIVPALTIGHSIGRFGCFLAGCCFGAETDWPWGIHLHGSDRHPTQLIEAVGLMALGLYLLKSKKDKLLLIVDYLLFYGGLRMLVEVLRGDDIRGKWGLLTPSQWISLILIILGLNLWKHYRNQRLRL